MSFAHMHSKHLQLTSDQKALHVPRTHHMINKYARGPRTFDKHQSGQSKNLKPATFYPPSSFFVFLWTPIRLAIHIFWWVEKYKKTLFWVYKVAKIIFDNKMAEKILYIFRKQFTTIEDLKNTTMNQYGLCNWINEEIFS